MSSSILLRICLYLTLLSVSTDVCAKVMKVIETENEFPMAIESWNHIESHQVEFFGLSLALKNYQVVINNDLRDINLIDNTNTKGKSLVEINTVLVKKMVDWTRQHSNGIKFSFDQEPVNFGEIKTVSIEVKIDFQKSKIIKNSDLVQNFKALKGDVSTWTEFNDEQLHLNVTFFGNFHDDQAISTIYANKIITLSPETTGCDWYSLKFNLAELAYFWQQNWEETPTTNAQAITERLMGIIVVAESKNGKTLRNYFKDKFPNNASEHFQEVSISLRKPQFINH